MKGPIGAGDQGKGRSHLSGQRTVQKNFRPSPPWPTKKKEEKSKPQVQEREERGGGGGAGGGGGGGGGGVSNHASLL